MEDEEEILEHLEPGMSDQDMKYLNSFTKQRSLSYDDKKKGIVIEEWLIHFEKILEAPAISDNGQMMRLSTYTFICVAEDWWKNVKRSRNVTRMR